MDSLVGKMYKEPGTHTKGIKNFLARFNYEYQAVKPEAGLYEYTTAGYFDKLNEARLDLLNAKRGEARRLKENYDSVKSSLRGKRERIFYPKSNGYNEAEKQSAYLQRNLAVSQLQAGNFNADALINQIDRDFELGNIDINGERYDYIKSHNFTGVGLDTQLKVLSALKRGFDKRGLSELNETEQDLKEGESSYQELVKTFQLG